MIRHPLRALTFDLDGTLWSVDDVLALAEQRLHDYLHETYPAVADAFEPERMRRLRRELAEAEPALARNATTLRRRVLWTAACDGGLGEPAAAELAERAFAVFLETRQAAVRPYPEVAPVLRRLARRWRLGVITNGNADVRRTAIAPYIDFVVRGVDLDIPKPEPEIFAYACRCAGAAPGEVLHVGDDPQGDVAGALGAGLQAALLCRDGALEAGEALPPGCLQLPDVAALERSLMHGLG
ncbi:HAD family hydrolase [Halorhodospira neutriphila]|nr:HAD-IA family hydrolase [Halorhodospira neutriphila]